MRRNFRSRTLEMLSIRSVLARPGTPVSRTWPRQKIEISTSSMMFCCPMMTVASCAVTWRHASRRDSTTAGSSTGVSVSEDVGATDAGCSCVRSDAELGLSRREMRHCSVATATFPHWQRSLRPRCSPLTRRMRPQAAHCMAATNVLVLFTGSAFSVSVCSSGCQQTAERPFGGTGFLPGAIVTRNSQRMPENPEFPYVLFDGQTVSGSGTSLCLHGSRRQNSENSV